MDMNKSFPMKEPAERNTVPNKIHKRNLSLQGWMDIGMESGNFPGEASMSHMLEP